MAKPKVRRKTQKSIFVPTQFAGTHNMPQGMAFTFQRIRDGEPVRTVKGKLIKYAK